VSRIYVGFHFRDAVETGVKHGDRIGTTAVKRVMRPAWPGTWPPPSSEAELYAR
jgi:hypothetical protein